MQIGIYKILRPKIARVYLVNTIAEWNVSTGTMTQLS